jgi:hypothetical protein
MAGTFLGAVVCTLVTFGLGLLLLRDSTDLGAGFGVVIVSIAFAYIGGVFGCFLALKRRNFDQPGRTALLVAVLLPAGAVLGPLVGLALFIAPWLARRIVTRRQA